MKKSLLAFITAVAAISAHAQTDWTSGEVRSIDVAQGQVTLQHGEIAGLALEPMKTTFGLENPALLDGLLVNTRVRFVATKRNGKYVIVKLDNR